MQYDLNLSACDISEEDILMEMEHEQEMLDAGRDKYFKQVLKEKERGNASRTGGGKSVISMMAMPLADIIVEEITRLESGSVRRKPPELRTLKLIPPRDIAVLSLMAVMDTLGYHERSRCTSQKVGFRIGDMVSAEYMAREFKRNEGGMFKAVVKRTQARSASPAQRQKEIAQKFKQMDETYKDPMDTTDKVRLGVFILAAMEHLGIVEPTTVYKGKKASKEYELSNHVVEQVAKMDELFADMQPYYGPTLIPPRRWTSTRSGGYWLGFRSSNMVVARNRSNGVDYAKDEDMPRVFEAVNYLQNVPYRINKRVLEVVRQMRKSNITCASLPPSELEAIPPKPHDIDTNEEARKAWRVSAREAHGRNTAAKGKILAVSKTIAVAQRYADNPAIYFPKCVDFRGRVYDIPMFLKPQGDDLSKGLLLFANGKPLGDEGGYWLAVHGANVWGEDKCSLDDRVAWVQANETRILKAAEEPFEERFWMEADKPFQFLAFCFEWAGAVTEGDDYVSHLPVALDGSCNGLQHLSAILRDPVGGAAVNLLPAGKPQDIYTEVLNKVLDELKTRAAQGEPTAQRWIPLMKRKTVKRNVMTLPYGATRTGFADQIMEDTLRPLQRDGLCPFSEPYNAARYLGEIVWEATGQVVVAARVAMDWLQECAKVVAKEGQNVQWTTPSGFVVKQDYRKLDSKFCTMTALGVRVGIRIASGPSPKLDSRKMAASIAPNFVHAMDAAHMLRTVEVMTDTDKSLHFSMVHDSYATHAADTETLSNLIRSAFVQMYQEGNWLKSFRREIALHLATRRGYAGGKEWAKVLRQLPPVPKAGNLHLPDVLKSLYFFA